MISHVIKIAAEELGLQESSLSFETKVKDIFSDSLEYISFIVALGKLGSLSDEAVSKAENLGDLADALVRPN